LKIRDEKGKWEKMEFYIAYSGRFRPAIPDEAGHPFRLIPATDSGRSRPPIPEQAGHPIN
jgi:hypothetical protein